MEYFVVIASAESSPYVEYASGSCSALPKTIRMLNVLNTEGAF